MANPTESLTAWQKAVLDATIAYTQATLALAAASVAASPAMIESLNRAAKQFRELSEASIKAATANMVRPSGKK